jgi:hypothetical protein
VEEQVKVDDKVKEDAEEEWLSGAAF